MDILSPSLMWINNRCYRVNPGQDNFDYQEATKEHDACPVEPQPYVEDGNLLYNYCPRIFFDTS